MKKREYREKHRKKTRYSSDSSDLERERRSKDRDRRYRKKSQIKKNTRKYSRSSSSSSRSKSSSSSSSSSSDEKYSKKSSSKNESSKKNLNALTKKMDEISNNFPGEQSKKFDLEDMYKDKSKALEEIESETFHQASFKSQNSKKIVDQPKDSVDPMQVDDESLIHPNFLGDDKKRVDKYIKKLHTYRNQQ
jgi:hypothetical protein